jgi:hypothetical protein
MTTRTDTTTGEDDLYFSKGRYRLIAAALIVLALAGAAGCVAADVF